MNSILFLHLVDTLELNSTESDSDTHTNQPNPFNQFHSIIDLQTEHFGNGEILLNVGLLCAMVCFCVCLIQPIWPTAGAENRKR